MNQENKKSQTNMNILCQIDPGNRDEKIKSAKKMLRKYQKKKARRDSEGENYSQSSSDESFSSPLNSEPMNIAFNLFNGTSNAVFKQAFDQKEIKKEAVQKKSQRELEENQGKVNITDMKRYEEIPKQKEVKMKPREYVLPSKQISIPQNQNEAILNLFERRVEKALHGRLYLLRRNGPKAFVVCSEVLYKKYRVLLGPQTCSCGREICVHLLFVMLRVFKVDRKDPILRTTNLKEYEVDTLLRRVPNLNPSNVHTKGKKDHTYIPEGPKVGHEDTCPICLLDLGKNHEPLTWCRHGCGNRLHRHCMDIWANEKRRLREKVYCPLCRADWETFVNSKLPGPFDTPIIDIPRLEDNQIHTRPLPHAEPLTSALTEKTKQWINILDPNLIECLFSTQWSKRESALRKLEMMLSPTSYDKYFAECNTTLLHDVLSSILKTCIEDPVLGVYVAALDLFRVVVFHVFPIQNASSQTRFQNTISMIISCIITRCCDANKRTSTKSVDLVLEVLKEPLFDSKFLLKCFLDGTHSTTWRWWLGRLDLGIVCLAEFPSVLQKMDTIAEDSLSQFIEKALVHSHLKVRSTALQVMILGCRVLTSTTFGKEKLECFLGKLQPKLRLEIEKRLDYLNALQEYDQLGCSNKPSTFSKFLDEKKEELKSDDIVKKEEEEEEPNLNEIFAGTNRLLFTDSDEDEMNVGIHQTLTNPSEFFGSQSLKPKLTLDTIKETSSPYIHGTHWKKGDILGSGAFSTCYTCFDLKTGSIFAVKQVHLLKNSSKEQEDYINGIYNEIQTMKQLNHPNIVRYYNCDLEENHLNIFLECVSGGSISSLLSKFGPFPEPVIQRYLHQILLGLEYLHQNGILHRDIKGANIFITIGGIVKLGDFGGSCKLKQICTLPGEFSSVRGTPSFMAPEVIKSEGYGRKSDIWSVGAVIVEMWNGKPPFVEVGDNPYAVMYRIATLSITSPSSLLPNLRDGINPKLLEIISSCLNVNQDRRPSATILLNHSFFVRTID